VQPLIALITDDRCPLGERKQASCRDDAERTDARMALSTSRPCRGKTDAGVAAAIREAVTAPRALYFN
jgi:hypothetical protein